MSEWHLYMIRTRKGAIYTGITTDVARRFREHGAGGAKAARYLRGRGPLTLVYAAKVGERSAALQVERAIKKMSKSKKEALIAGQLSLDGLLNRAVNQ